ncbi:flagellar hook-length control protein FliK [Chachezhania antarctica]|uniref:flagellar hook-length control protein FliK n=1 Tax=Chachezhania antarctica TaxID=2340860 RepID=UPI0013CED8A3|nr:flagellar hook-length control protein FliK [Chachezhania antarctica]
MQSFSQPVAASGGALAGAIGGSGKPSADGRAQTKMSASTNAQTGSAAQAAPVTVANGEPAEGAPLLTAGDKTRTASFAQLYSGAEGKPLPGMLAGESETPESDPDAATAEGEDPATSPVENESQVADGDSDAARPDAHLAKARAALARQSETAPVPTESIAMHVPGHHESQKNKVVSTPTELPRAVEKTAPALAAPAQADPRATVAVSASGAVPEQARPTAVAETKSVSFDGATLPTASGKAITMPSADVPLAQAAPELTGAFRSIRTGHATAEAMTRPQGEDATTNAAANVSANKVAVDGIQKAGAEQFQAGMTAGAIVAGKPATGTRQAPGGAMAALPAAIAANASELQATTGNVPMVAQAQVDTVPGSKRSADKSGPDRPAPLRSSLTSTGGAQAIAAASVAVPALASVSLAQPGAELAALSVDAPVAAEDAVAGLVGQSGGPSVTGDAAAMAQQQPAGGTSAVRQILPHIAELMSRPGERSVEIALEPVELGRVRMMVSMAEGGVTLQITAERPETLDLMRRHIETLAEELRRMGYAEVGLSFTTGDSPSEDSRRAMPEGHAGDTGDVAASDLPGAAETARPRSRTIPASGMDIRV